MCESFRLMMGQQYEGNKNKSKRDFVMPDNTMHSNPSGNINHAAENDHSTVSINMDIRNRSCKRSQDLIGVDYKFEGVANGLFQIYHNQQTTRFVIAEPSRVIKMPFPAPPPKLHYSTFWRSVTRRLYRTYAMSRLKKLQGGVHGHALASRN